MSETETEQDILDLLSASEASNLGYEDVQRSIEAVRVQNLCAILAYLLQSTKASLADSVVITVEQIT